MKFEELCRSLGPEGKRDHSPRINRDLTMIIGCTCGWRTPSCVTDSDDAFSMHVAITRAAEGMPQ